MPETQTTLSLEEARSQLYRKLHAPFFLQKLAADYGVVPQNEAEAAQLLGIGDRLLQAKAEEAAQKQAAVNPLIAQAYASLGGAPAYDASAMEKAAANAAEQVLQDDEIRRSVGVLVGHLLAK